MASIIDLSNKRPRAYVRVTLGAGPRSSGAAPITILLMGSKTEATPSEPLEDNTMEQVFDEDRVIAGTGAGSELHRMYRQVAKINPRATVYIGAIATGGGAQATLTKTLSGTATENATLEVTIGCDSPVNVPIAAGDTAAEIIATAVSALNAVPHSPVIATGDASGIKLTAKCAGPRGNGIKVRTRWVDGSGAGLTFTAEPSGEALTGGTTSDSPEALLANTTAVRFHLTVAPYGTTAEAAQVQACAAHIAEQAGPLVGKRGRLIIGNTESLGAAQMFAYTDVNHELVQIAWSQLANETPAECAAALAGRLSVGLAQTRAFNFDNEELNGLRPQWDLASRPTEGEITSALNNGLTPLFVAGNAIRIARSITSKSRTVAGGSTFDYSVLDSHYVDVPFFLADLLEENFYAAFPNFALGVDVEGEAPPPKVATASTVRAWALSMFAPYDNSLIENYESVTVAGSSFTRNEDAKGRIDAVIPVDVIELFHQFAADIRQMG